jgi:hypothetical protein
MLGIVADPSGNTESEVDGSALCQTSGEGLAWI